jgi:hypothetical protein
VNIFQFDLRPELARFEFLENFPEARDDFFGFGGFQDFTFLQGPAMRNTAFDIVGIQSLVEEDGGRKPQHQFVCGFLESAAPGLFHDRFRKNSKVLKL